MPRARTAQFKLGGSSRATPRRKRRPLAGRVFHLVFRRQIAGGLLLGLATVGFVWLMPLVDLVVDLRNFILRSFGAGVIPLFLGLGVLGLALVRGAPLLSPANWRRWLACISLGLAAFGFASLFGRNGFAMGNVSLREVGA